MVNKKLTNQVFNQMMLQNATTLRRAIIDKVLSSSRDINYECQYPDVITPQDYRDMYEREGVGTRVVQIFPEESWNVQPKISDNDTSSESTWDKEWAAISDKHNIFHYLYRLDVLSGIGSYGALLIGIDDGEQLNEPIEGIDPVTGVATRGGTVTRKITYLKPFDASMITIKETEKNVTSPRYSYPVQYGLKINGAEVVVHWTRILHVADNRDASDVYGVPRMQTVYNRLLDIRKTLGGSGEMFWKGGFPGYAFTISPERTTALSESEKEAFKDEVANYMNGLQRYFALSGMEAKSLAPQVADPTAHFTTQIKAIAITLGAPYRVFLGTEEAKLAGAQDTRAWLRRITKRQNVYLTPLMLRPFINRLMDMKVLKPLDEFNVEWPVLDSLDEETAAKVLELKTKALASYVNSGVDSLIPPLEYFVEIYGMDQDRAMAMVKAMKKWVDDTVGGDDGDIRPDEDDAAETQASD